MDQQKLKMGKKSVYADTLDDYVNMNAPIDKQRLDDLNVVDDQSHGNDGDDEDDDDDDDIVDNTTDDHLDREIERTNDDLDDDIDDIVIDDEDVSSSLATGSTDNNTNTNANANSDSGQLIDSLLLRQQHSNANNRNDLLMLTANQSNQTSISAITLAAQQRIIIIKNRMKNFQQIVKHLKLQVNNIQQHNQDMLKKIVTLNDEIAELNLLESFTDLQTNANQSMNHYQHQHVYNNINTDNY